MQELFSCLMWTLRIYVFLLLSSGKHVMRLILLILLFESSISSQFFVCLVHQYVKDVFKISHYKQGFVYFSLYSYQFFAFLNLRLCY